MLAAPVVSDMPQASRALMPMPRTKASRSSEIGAAAVTATRHRDSPR